MLETAYYRKFPSLYRGVVEDNVDPDHLGRCRVRVPFIHGKLNYPPDALPWARPIVTSPVRRGRGSVSLPDKGDVVWVFFEGSDKKFPVYIGGTYGEKEIVTNPNIVDFYIENKTKLSYDRIKKSYSITIGDIIIEVTEEGVHITGDTTISGDLVVEGNLSIGKNLKVLGESTLEDANIKSNLTVEGTTTVNNLVILGSCNREGG